MKIILKILFLMLFYSKFGVTQIEKIDYLSERDTTYKAYYQIFNPYSFLSYNGFPVQITKKSNGCINATEYLEPSGQEIRLILNFKDYDSLKYECNNIHFDVVEFDSVTDFSVPLLFIDSLLFDFEGNQYKIEKYKAEVLEGEFVTIYYSELLGIIKQYGSYRSISTDNFEMEFLLFQEDKKRELINAHLRAIWLNDAFHERYDEGPRTIRNRILDKKCYRKTKRKYKKRGFIISR